MSKPLASLSLDLDNQWSYMKTHGDSGWEQFPSYLDRVVPRILEILAARNLTITFFIVGQDAALSKNAKALSSIAEAGHEIANHSFHHEPWLHLYSPAELESEFARSEEAIFEATGKQTRGFRGPGFSMSQQVLKLLVARGYQYDASTFPTFLGPLARTYYLFSTKLGREEKQERKELFGKLSDGFQTLRPFRWNLQADLIEIPVTTMPVFKVPFHLTYIHFLAQRSRWAAKLHFWKSIKLCKLMGIRPSLLLHPLDFLGADDDTGLDYFPGMKLATKIKLELQEQILDMYAQNFEVVPMQQHARQVLESGRLPSRDIRFVHAGISE